LGFWAALRKVWPETREQRCWVHKTSNVLNKMPKGLQGELLSRVVYGSLIRRRVV